MTKLYLIARIAGEAVAVPAADVEAVVEVEAISSVPRTAQHVRGLAALRSRVLTVIDCRLALELGRSEDRNPHEAIVVRCDGHSYALLVDAVDDVLEIAGQVEPVRAQLGLGWRRVASGMIEVGGNMLLLIDPHALIAGPAREAAAAA